MSRQYHYLVAGLPDLFFDDSKLSIDSLQFSELLAEHLPSDDLVIIRLFFWRYDNRNILTKLKDPESKIDIKGNLTGSEVDELIDAVKKDSFREDVSGIPAYIAGFIEAYKNENVLITGKSWDLQFTELYYRHTTATRNVFVSKWFEFERDLNNIFTAAKCRKHNISLEGQLIGSGELVDKLMRSTARDFGLDNEFPFLDQLLKALEEEDFLEQEKKIDRIKWDYLDEAVFFFYFTIERIFSFLIKLTIVERWFALDKETGQQLFNELLTNLEASYEFPEEFQ
ncbi:hypothetical protein ES705_23992 [subsurface metagenome]